MSEHNTEYELAHEPELHRYVIQCSGEVIGFAHYAETTDAIDVDSTVVAPSHRGGGVASRLVRYALDQLRDSSSKRITASCPYVASWIERHEDYQTLLTR